MDLRNVFPANKIRTEIRKDEDIGKITKTAVDIVAACSAVFVQKLAHSATKIIVDNATSNPISETNTNGRVVTSDHVRQVIKSDLDSYDFLFGHNKRSNIEANSDDSLLCNLKEERAPPLK